MLQACAACTAALRAVGVLGVHSISDTFARSAGIHCCNCLHMGEWGARVYCSWEGATAGLCSALPQMSHTVNPQYPNLPHAPKPETLIPAVGVVFTDANFSRACTAGAFVTSIQGASSTSGFSTLGPFGCSNAALLAAVGATAASTFNDASVVGYTAVAVGYSGTRITKITLFKADGAFKPFGATAAPLNTRTVACPQGKVIVGFNGRASTAFPSTIGIYCR